MNCSSKVTRDHLHIRILPPHLRIFRLQLRNPRVRSRTRAKKELEDSRLRARELPLARRANYQADREIRSKRDCRSHRCGRELAIPAAEIVGRLCQTSWRLIQTPHSFTTPSHPSSSRAPAVLRTIHFAARSAPPAKISRLSARCVNSRRSAGPLKITLCSPTLSPSRID